MLTVSVMDFVHPKRKCSGMRRDLLSLIAFVPLFVSGVKVGAAQQSKPPEPAPQAAAVSTVTVAPDHVTLSPGDSKSFSATVSGTGAFINAVTWSVNDVAGGNTKLGTIDGTGKYVTPYPVPPTVTGK